jgi:TonB family protein
LKATTEADARRFAFFLLVPALVCFPRAALPQGHATPPVIDPIVLGAKQATQLLLTQATPEYPAIARVNYIQGQVRLGVEVKSDGKIGRAHVLAGNPLLAASALKAIRGWSYRPLRAPTGPSGFLTEVVIKFSLHARALTHEPSHAERDLARQVKPPQVSGRPPRLPSNTSVHMRLLVSDQGKVIDIEPSNDSSGDMAAARRIVQTWTFRPAHWGTLPIPWYIDVDVPIAAPPIPLAAHASLIRP